jgi:thiol-disulfide isomerase/thioredoxin
VRGLALIAIIGLAVLITLVFFLLGAEDEPDDKERPPVEGTTKGFLLPDVSYTDHLGDPGTLRELEADYTVLHVVSPIEAPFNPQYVQLKVLRDQFANVTIEALTLSADGRSSPTSMATLRGAMGADWSFGVPEEDLNSTLSLIDFPTVFLLDGEKVVLERSDEPIGQGALIGIIEGLWGLEPDPDIGPYVGEVAPEIVWRDIDGNEGTLSDLRGSVVIVNVWEYECPWCMQLFPQLRKVFQNYSAEGVEMVSLDLITWETEDLVRTVAEEHNATWAFAVDGDNLQSRYDLWRLPSIMILDQDGVVRWRAENYVPSSIISEEVEKLI